MEHEIIICAAIKATDGTVIPGRRHHDCIRTLREIPRYSADRLAADRQGFITSRNRFVDRAEAMEIQLAAGIASVNPGGYQGDELYSEDLY